MWIQLRHSSTAQPLVEVSWVNRRVPRGVRDRLREAGFEERPDWWVWRGSMSPAAWATQHHTSLEDVVVARLSALISAGASEKTSAEGLGPFGISERASDHAALASTVESSGVRAVAGNGGGGRRRRSDDSVVGHGAVRTVAGSLTTAVGVPTVDQLGTGRDAAGERLDQGHKGVPRDPDDRRRHSRMRSPRRQASAASLARATNGLLTPPCIGSGSARQCIATKRRGLG